MGKTPIQMKAVVYSLSPFQQKVIPGLWRDLPHKLGKKFSENWINATLLVAPVVGVYAGRATDEYESVRIKVARFINASESIEIVFTRNATEAMNLVAYSWGLLNLRPGDEIILTIAEHHSAIVPFQIVAQKTGATLKFVSLTEEEVLDIDKLKEMLSEKTKLVVTHHFSNTLGSVLPIKDITSWSHNVGAKVLVDACQSVPHMVIDVQSLDADFLVASSHKMCGPTGVGFLYGKKVLSGMPPFLGGGKMISDVFLDHSTYAERSPSRFEAGTPAIGEVIGLGAAIDYLSGIGMQKIHDYEIELATYLHESLCVIINVRIYGPVPSEHVSRAALCSFNVENIHPTDIATFHDQEFQYGVAIMSACQVIIALNLSIDTWELMQVCVLVSTSTTQKKMLMHSLEA